MNLAEATQRIEAIFGQYKSLRPTDSDHLQALDKGKVYKLYVLSGLVLDLRRRGCQLSFPSSTLVFKSAPGKIQSSDPHFRVAGPLGPVGLLFVNIEFETMGSKKLGANARPDLSTRHELDLVLVRRPRPYPSYSDVLLAVECKSQASFDKQVVRAALGVRRELSLLAPRRPSHLTQLTQAKGSRRVRVPALPASEFWLAYHDPKGDNYRSSPKQFGIEFRHIPLP